MVSPVLAADSMLASHMALISKYAYLDMVKTNPMHWDYQSNPVTDLACTGDYAEKYPTLLCKQPLAHRFYEDTGMSRYVIRGNKQDVNEFTSKLELHDIKYNVDDASNKSRDKTIVIYFGTYDQWT